MKPTLSFVETDLGRLIVGTHCWMSVQHFQDGDGIHGSCPRIWKVLVLDLLLMQDNRWLPCIPNDAEQEKA